ncbi:Fermentation associated protein [Zalerion maritima]|uniref:Fermentation associated protein n=1 Tax=Zalerion maritima TaxID=339359 RepID=A0AAD5RIP4_9PEZI|nr:Fermentation associated protein [Zalerion maritima]
MASEEARDFSGYVLIRPSSVRLQVVFLVYVLVCCLLAILFLLYFNRLFASVISYIIRTWTWHHHKVWIDIQALQISLLGGRIFFTGLRYHGNNETILMQNGHITWSYWLRRVREVDLPKEQKGYRRTRSDSSTATNTQNPPDPEEQRSSDKSLPCRINVKVSGVEWFVYNRTPAYDSVLEAMLDEQPESDATGTENGQAVRRSNTAFEKREDATERPKRAAVQPNSLSPSDDDNLPTENETPLFLDLLPIHIECNKAAVVMGNSNTKAVLLVKADALDGDIDASASPGPDPYRQLFKLRFKHPVVEMRDNEDFKEDQASKAQREKDMTINSDPVPKRSIFRRYRRRVVSQLRNLVPYWRTSVESFSQGSEPEAPGRVPGADEWQGLARYLNENDEDDRTRWASVEYAAIPTLLESPEASLTIYWDVVGKVPPHSGRPRPQSGVNNINGDIPPAWAIDVSLKGGTMNYGPWADRHRAALQGMFVPSISKDSTPATLIPIGSYRVATQFNLYIESEEELTLRIPIREESKNWKYRGKEMAAAKLERLKRRFRSKSRKSDKAATPSHERPYGWLELKVSRNATVKYSMDMVAGTTGYAASLNLDLPRAEISTSVNHSQLWRSGPVQVTCDLSTPLKWNGLRTWSFNIATSELELFILRDHVFLIIDLVGDWGSGPPPEYLVFTPFKYNVTLDIRQIDLFLNVNDANIVNDPTSFEDNTFLVLSLPSLLTNLCIPLDNFRPSTNAIPFRVQSDLGSLHLRAPPWNTQAAFLNGTTLGQVESLVVDGNYHYNATTSSANTDTLTLDVSGQAPWANLYGFLIRYLLSMKDNYFGGTIHFKTLEEYQEMLLKPPPQPPHKKTNDLDVILAVRVDDPKLFLPANLYSARKSIQVELATISADLRFTNYYMDMALSVSPASVSLRQVSDGTTTPLSGTSGTQVFVDGISVHGHRLFGLPPGEPTYVCNWDFSVGAVTGECGSDFLSSLVLGGRAFAFSFDDDENALVNFSAAVFNDITFLRAQVESVRLWLHVDEAAFLLSTGSINVNFNDWARTHYSTRAEIAIPDVQLSCLTSESAARHKSRHNMPVDTDAFIQTAIRAAIVGRKADFTEQRRLQQEIVCRHDQRTERTPFLLLPGVLEETPHDSVDLPAQSVPPMATPETHWELLDDKTSFSTEDSLPYGRRLKRKSSFLSLGSSATGKSVVRPHSKIGHRDHRRKTFVHKCEHSASPGRHSDLYSAAGDYERRETHTSVAFSSPYFPPYFPLESVRPSARDILAPVDKNEHDDFNRFEFDLDDVDENGFEEGCVYTSILLELPVGFTGFITPDSLQSVSSLISAIHPSEPIDIIDTLQVDSISAVFALRKKALSRGKIVDFLIRVPQANVQFVNSSDAVEEQDHYTLSLSKLAAAVRMDMPNSRISFNASLDSASVSAAEKLVNMTENQAALLGQIEDVTLAMGTKEVRYIDGEIGVIRGSTSSEKVQYLASLIHRTGVLADEIDRLFSVPTAAHVAMVRHFVYSVVTDGDTAPDPSFLTRPSAVLRSATDHLRTVDSWKLVSRLRQMWICLPRERLVVQMNTPQDARDQVISNFQRWRGWDLGSLGDCILVNNVFRPVVREGPTDDLPLLAVLKVANIDLILDPGPKQNQIILRDITTRVETKGVDDITHPPELLQGVTCPINEVNVFCGLASVSVNWELCELAEDILKLEGNVKHSTPQSPGEEKVPAERSSTRKITHMVIALGKGSLDIETVNLNTKSDWIDIQTSLLLSHGGEDRDMTNLVLSCDSMKSKVKSHAQLLGRIDLFAPSIFASHELQEGAVASHTIKSTASCRQLSLVVKQDPIGLLEVADLLVKDEVTQLYQLTKQFPLAPKQELKPRNERIVQKLSSIRLDLAMFLEGYSISVPLLQSLTYTISSEEVARASLAAHFGKEVTFDFDIQKNDHKMLIDVKSEPTAISVLQIPPTNGRVTSFVRNGENSVSVVASVMLVTLDAPEVYNLLTALNRPEITNAISDVKEQGSLLQEHMSDVFGTPDAPVQKPDSTLVYSAHLTFEGLEIFGNTPLKSEMDPVAKLSFALGSVHLEIANRLEQRGPTLEDPEIHVNIKQVSFEILKGTRTDLKSCGNVSFGALLTANSRPAEDGITERTFNIDSDGFEVNLSPDTIATVVDVLGFFEDKIKDIDTSKELEYLRRLRQSNKPRIAINDEEQQEDIIDSFLSSFVYTFEVRNIQLCWQAVSASGQLVSGREDLVLSLERFAFTTRRKKTAKLTIENLQLQMVPPNHDKLMRSANSALLPEVIFNIAYFSTPDARRFAFQAVGKSLDLRLTSGFIIPASNLSHSISLSAKNVQQAYEHWSPNVIPEKPVEAQPPRPFFAKKRLESMLVDADFAGAVVHLSGKRTEYVAGRPNMAGKYGQFNPDESGSNTVLRSPGLALKLEFRDTGKEVPSLYAEVKIDASSNILYPSVVPLIMDITSSVKEVVADESEERPKLPKPQMKRSVSDDDKILTADPTAVIGRLKLNIGLRIRRQEFSLSCQPIARVAATARFDDVYLTMNTIRSADQGNFFAISGACSGLQVSVQHVYSRESTGSFEVDNIGLSLMNSKHVSGTSGVSAILKVSPMNVSINAKQLHDFLLFREIWRPAEIRQKTSVPVTKLSGDASQTHLVQRYQEVAATAAFPWTATISITALQVSVDLGQALGKPVFAIEEFWVSSKKTSDWEQNLCLGFEKIGVDCAGRLSGFVSLRDFKLRTAIQWPQRERALNETPLVQASVGFSQFRVKAAFDYQVFLVANITSMEFLMYNVRRRREGSGDRLVAIFNGDAAQVFGTSTSAAQAVALWQAVQKLIQERKANFETSLREIEKFMKRRTVSSYPSNTRTTPSKMPEEDTLSKSPISLDTDVVVTLKTLNLGVFPSTFSDHQVFKMEALDAQVRFAASIEERQIHSILGVTLGQLRIGLAGIREGDALKSASDVSVEDVVKRATGSRGGTILKVPKVEAVMQTWQKPSAMHIDYIFKSEFSGKVEVGWNYSRVSYIKGMWANHSKTLEQTWGKELQPLTGIKVTGVLPDAPPREKEDEDKKEQQQKITAEVTVPQSKYNYRALEPPIIETPQLRDMGEATPPLEWIGLHRDKLPNLTHQIVIVSLLELAGEVEDAYSRILGSS